MNRIYPLIGQIIEIVQYIEYNIVELICEHSQQSEEVIREKWGTSTLGQLLGELQHKDLLNEDLVEQLEKALHDRNHIVHQYFKKNDFVKHSDNEEMIKNQENYLKNRLHEMEDLNEQLYKQC
ncbi:MAG: hypothetical protein FWD76_01635, partial [Firmicutes bacterium]|nr:hypothetical protein [Bacillota bacterium]